MLALAAALRAAHVLALRDTPFFEHLVVDPAHYDAWAQRIAAGDWLGDRPFYMDPLYPYVLGGLYRIFGRDLLAVRLVQVGMSVGACALVARLGARVGGPKAGIVAALWLALYKPEIMFAAEIEKTTLSVLLTAATLTLFLEPGRGLAAGFALGLAVLTRGNLLLFAPLGALALWCMARRGARLRAPALLLAGFALALAPVAWRNHAVGGSWDPTTTQGGQNFYMGNNPDNLSGSYGALPFLRMNPAFEEEDFRVEAERRAGRGMTPAETSRFWYGEAWRFFREAPATALGLLGRKLAIVWNDYEISDNVDQYLLARDSAVMALPLPGFGVTLAFAAVGAAAGIATGPAVRVLAGFALVYATSVAAFFVFARYRIQLVPALVPLAALGLTRLLAHARRPARLAADAAIALAAGAFAFQTIPPFEHGNPQVDAMRLQRRAEVHLVANDADGAIAVLHEAVAVCPDRCPGALGTLIAVYEATGRTAQAVAWLEQLVAAQPANPHARAELARLRATGG